MRFLYVPHADINIYAYSSYNNLYDAIYEAVLNIQNQKSNEIKVILSSGNREIECDSLIIDECFKIKSSLSGITYDITNIFALKELRQCYEDLNIPTDNQKDKFLEMAILKITSVSNNNLDIPNFGTKIQDQTFNQTFNQIFKPSKNDKTTKQIAVTKPAKSTTPAELVNSIKDEINADLKELNNLFKTHGNSFIEKKSFENKPQNKNEPAWKNDFDEQKNNIQYKYVDNTDGDNSSDSENINDDFTDTDTSDSNSDCSSETSDFSSSSSKSVASVSSVFTDVETKEIEKQIEMLEKLKKSADKQINESLLNIDNDKKNLLEHHCDIAEHEFKLKREEERLKQEYNIFVSERDYTYGLIYDKFFVKKQIKGWDCVPPFFMLKFPIFVFLDGKNTEGQNVRPRLLDTKDDFRLYKLLYNSIVSSEFEPPEDEEDARIVSEFLESFPPVPIITEDDINEMMLNEDTIGRRYRRIFEEDEISKQSCSDYNDSDEDKN